MGNESEKAQPSRDSIAASLEKYKKQHGITDDGVKKTVAPTAVNIPTAPPKANFIAKWRDKAASAVFIEANSPSVGSSNPLTLDPNLSKFSFSAGSRFLSAWMDFLIASPLKLIIPSFASLCVTVASFPDSNPSVNILSRDFSLAYSF